MEDTHTAADIAKFLEEALIEWGLVDKLHVFVRDNDIKLVNALKVNGWQGVGCFLHTLQLVVNKCITAQIAVKNVISKAQEIGRKFKSSCVAKAAFEKHQLNNNVPRKVLILSNDTRWSSVFDMLERFQVWCG